MPAEIAAADVDLFCDESLRDPFPDYRKLRDAGPVVHLADLNLYAVARFADVRQALRDSDALRSGEGVGFNDVFNAPKGNNVIQSDDDLHRRLRAAVVRPLGRAQLSDVRPRLKAMMVERIASLQGAGEFDAMRQLASFLPVEAVAHLVGLPPEGRERMLDWAAATFNAIGPTQDAADLASLAEARAFMAGLDASRVERGSWAAQLFEVAAQGRISPAEALAAISAYVLPSLDTTIMAMGSLLENLAHAPEQWAMLRARPELIPAAVLEGVRHRSVIRWFARTAAVDHSIDGTTIPADARVMLLYSAANRDERHYADPDRFDVTRDARDHLAWGTGPHMCAGMHLARIEMEVLIEALVELQAELHAGEPVMSTNRGLYGFAALSFRIERG